MYQITVNGTVVYDTRYRGQYPLISPVLELGMNQAGTLGFTVLPNHPYYANFQRMKSFVKFYRDSEELFYGRIITIEKDIYGQMAVNCEGAFTFFLDSELEKGEYTETIPAFITRCITVHNSQVEVEKRFTVGQMTANKAVEIDPSTGSVIQIKFAIQDYATTKSTLESLITGKYGGCFRVRPNPNGYPYLDYIQDYGRTNPQTIKIAENIISKTDHISGENIFSILRPIGKDGLTIDSLSQSDISLPNVVKDGKTLRLTEMITAYGSIIRTERFSDIDDAHTLLKAAEEFITRYGSQLPSTSTVGYVDFHLLNPQIDAVRVGDMFTNIDGFPDETLTVGELRINAENPADDEIVFKNREELNANDPTSSSSGLSASYASQCTHIDYVYKHISEQDEILILTAEQLQIHANKITSMGDWIDLTAGAVEVDSTTGHLIVKQGYGLYIEKNNGIQYGVYDDGTLTGGVLVNKINDNTTLIQIQADRINLSGYVKADELAADISRIQQLDVLTLRGTSASFSGNVSATGAIMGYDVYVGGMGSYQSLSSGIKSIAQNPNPPSGQIGIVYTQFDGTTQTVNFNIAATQTYIDGVAAAYNSVYVSGIDVDSEYSYGGYHYITLTVHLPNGNDSTQTIRVPIS